MNYETIPSDEITSYDLREANQAIEIERLTRKVRELEQWIVKLEEQQEHK